MKLRYALVLLVQLNAMSLVAMSAKERAVFKKQLMQTQTSQEMERMVRGKLLDSTVIRLHLYDTHSCTMMFSLYAPPSLGDSPQVEFDVCNVLEEVFFTEMHPFIFGTASKADALKTVARYQWAREYVRSPQGNTDAADILQDFDPIFDMHSCQQAPTELKIEPVAIAHRYNYARRKCAKYTGEDRICGGKEWLSRKVFGYTYAPLGAKISHVALPLMCVAATAALWHYVVS